MKEEGIEIAITLYVLQVQAVILPTKGYYKTYLMVDITNSELP